MFKYGYVTHSQQKGLYKLDLANMRYVRTIDLSSYNCVPNHLQFSALCKCHQHYIFKVFKKEDKSLKKWESLEKKIDYNLLELF